MSGTRRWLVFTAAGGLVASAYAHQSPAAGQSQTTGTPTPIERFLALPLDSQEALRNQVQPLFFQSMQANGRLIRMAQDCNMPLPTEATPAARLEADLQSPQSGTGKLFGPARQGALLARLRGAMQATIDCRQAADMRPEMIRQLREFPREFQSVLERGLAVAGQGGTAAAPEPGAAHTPTPGTLRAAPLPGTAPGSEPAGLRQLPRVLIGAPGRCELMTGGQAQPCISGLLYLQSREGPVLISVQSTPTSTIGFQGSSDSQPRPEQYTLHLGRMHTSVDGRTAAKSVTGTCEISMRADGQVWYRATCRARDGNGLETVMTFTGDGRPVTAAHPGAGQPKSPVPE